jgi:Na+/proline symporter
MTVETVFTAIFLFLALLFCVAFYADFRRRRGRSIIANPAVYVLSFGVWFTSWTFYGNVGRVATVGIDYIAIYLGVTLVFFSGWFLLRKMVRISKNQNLVSIADFIASRYGNSTAIGALAALGAVAGTLPYIAVQLKGISDTFNLLIGSNQGPYAQATAPLIDSTFVVAALLCLFSILFGARRLDPSDRHEGLVAAVAFEGLLKIFVMGTVGLFFVYGLFDGFGDIFQRFLAEYPERRELLLLGTDRVSYSSWFALGSVCAMAFVCLPHLFHLSVVENSKEEHIRSAMWGFPLYMFVIELFILPIALGGLILSGGDTSRAEYFPILIPLQEHHPWLALLVFLGGFSGSTGMVIVSAVALSTLILNHLLMPLFLRLRLPGADFSGTLLNLKRLGIVVVILLAYAFYRVAGEMALVNIGIISFVGAAQFAPALLGGLFWKRANLKGAFAGLLLGLSTWFYLMVLPTMAPGSWLEGAILKNGPFGLSWLRPATLFGLEGLPWLPYVLFCTLLLNVCSFLAFSLLSEPSEAEKEQADRFVDVFAPPAKPETRQRIAKAPSVVEFVDLMTKFIGEKRTHETIADFLEDQEIDARGSLSEGELSRLKRFAEKTLAGSVGAAPARIIIDNYLASKGSRMEEVFDIFGSVTISHRAGREQLGVLHEAARRVASGGDLQSILDSILELLQQQFRLDLCVIRILDEKRATLTVRSWRGVGSERLGLIDREPNMETYVGECFVNQTNVVVNDADFLDKAVSAQAVRREGIQAFAHAPIVVEGKTIGVLSAFSKSVKGIFVGEFMELFANLAGQVGVAWRNARQTERLIAARERDRELEIARDIQQGLLPTRTPDIRGISLAGTCLPAQEVGGDYYDFLPTGPDSVDLLIADVSGHTVGAAFIMTEARTFIRARAQELARPCAILSALNAFSYEDLSRAELFITMFYAKYHAPSRALFFASAGHNPPLLSRKAADTCERLDAEGLILGIKPIVDFEEKKVRLRQGDVLLFYTDGITEAEDHGGNFFGEERLCVLLREHRDLEPPQLIERLLESVRRFTGGSSFKDDLTLVAMRVEE